MTPRLEELGSRVWASSHPRDQLKFGITLVGGAHRPARKNDALRGDELLARRPLPPHFASDVAMRPIRVGFDANEVQREALKLAGVDVVFERK